MVRGVNSTARTIGIGGLWHCNNKMLWHLRGQLSNASSLPHLHVSPYFRSPLSCAAHLFLHGAPFSPSFLLPLTPLLPLSTYEVATAAAIALGADKLICLLDGQVLDGRGRLVRWLTLAQVRRGRERGRGWGREEGDTSWSICVVLLQEWGVDGLRSLLPPSTEH